MNKDDAISVEKILDNINYDFEKYKYCFDCEEDYLRALFIVENAFREAGVVK